MWNNMPIDLLTNILSYLPPHYLARAMAACGHWHDCGRSMTGEMRRHNHHPPWFVALPTRITTTTTGIRHLCFIHNPIDSTWHMLNLDHVPSLNRPVSTIGGQGLILFKAIGGVPLRLSVCNLFTGQFRQLPPLLKPRTNPAVGVVEVSTSHFKIYVAGGMSEAASGGAASYEPTLEMLDSKSNKWVVVGSMPVEFAVRLTVWTPNESVYASGVLYWMTSARAYSIMGFDMATNKWKELSVPMGDTLEFAALVPQDGKLRVVGGTHGGSVCVWELGEGGTWNMIEQMPEELRKRFVGGGSKCVGIEGGVCLYSREIGSGMVVLRRRCGDSKGRWEWCWIEGYNRIGERRIENYPIKGFFLHPNLAASDSPFI